MLGIMRDEITDEQVHFADVELALLRGQSSLDQRACAAAHQIACDIIGHRRKALAGEDEIERGNKIGRGLDQRSVEIEHHRRGNSHDQSAIG